MSAFRIRGRALHVGVALDDRRVVAVLPGDAGTTVFERALSPGLDGEAVWPDLAAALAALRESCLDALGTVKESSARPWNEAFLHIALMSPLAHLRRVELPGLDAAEAYRVCGREPWRYLPVPDDGPTVNLAIEGTGWRQASPFTLLAARETLVEEIGAAAREGGWAVAEIVPAQAAWAAGASAFLPDAAGGAGTLVVALATHVEILGVSDRRVVRIRRLPASASDVAAMVVSVLEGVSSRPVAVLGASSFADALRDRIARSDLIVQAPGGETSREQPAELAARFVRGAAGPALLPAAEQRQRLQRIRRGSVARFAAAVALLLAGGAVSALGVEREAAAVAAERARIRPAVAVARALRDSVAIAERRLATLRRAEAGAPRWSALIASLSTVLPEDAFLVSLRADADSVRIEGSAAEAATVFDAVRQVHSLGSASPAGPIRQEVQPDGAVRERFALAAPLQKAP